MVMAATINTVLEMVFIMLQLPFGSVLQRSSLRYFPPTYTTKPFRAQWERVNKVTAFIGKTKMNVVAFGNLQDCALPDGTDAMVNFLKLYRLFRGLLQLL